MALWQFILAIQGWNDTQNSAEAEPEAPSADEFYEMLERLSPSSQ